MSNKNFKTILDGLSVKHRAINSSVLMVDGLNTFLRSFTVINHVNTDGQHIGGLTGALKSIAYGIRISNPTYVIIVFDGVASSTWRRNIYPEYKTNRHKNRATNYDIFSSKEEEDQSVKDQITRLMQYLQCLPVSLISIDATEADDIIGYLTSKFEKSPETERVTIMSADRDFLQLASEKTRIYSPTKKKMYGPDEVLEEYGIPSHNFIMQKILLGDVSDNIPGVVGLGPKKLLKFFPEVLEEKQYTINEILLKSVDKIKEHKLYESICAFQHQLEINHKLMDLKNIQLSEANEELVKEMLSNKGTLNKYIFLRMYEKDKLGDSITNVTGWINDNFSYLDSL